MNAETLRRAATSMRKRAKAATPGENWEHDTKPYGHADEASVAINYRPSVFAAGYVGTRANAAHIASWHPAVAPSEWLVNTGLDWKKGQPREWAQKIPSTRPAATITTRSVGQWRVYTSDTEYRGLTEREAGILQTFPADYPWRGATQLARATQIGNAIPPRLAAHILAALDVGTLEAAA